MAEDLNSALGRYSKNGRQISPRNESLTGGAIRAGAFVAEAAGHDAIVSPRIGRPKSAQERHSTLKGCSRFQNSMRQTQTEMSRVNPRLPPAHPEIRLEPPIFAGHPAGVAGSRPTAAPCPT